VTSDFNGIGNYGSGTTGGSAQLTYYVVVTGGNMGDAVPLDVSAVLSTNAGGQTANDVTDAGATITLSFANGNSSDSQRRLWQHVARCGLLQ